MSVYFFSDPHFGHEAIAKKRGFSNADEQTAFIIEKWNNTINKRDLVFLLGDISNEKKSYYPILDELQGIKTVILGNHDRKQDVPALLACKSVTHVAGMIKYKGFFLTHAPIHSAELKYRKIIGNIHGHMHNYHIKNYRYFNVCAEKINYTPISFFEIEKQVQNFKRNWFKRIWHTI